MMSGDLKKEIWEWIRTILFSAIMALLILQVVRPTVVKEISMEPTLMPNDYLLLERVSHRLDKLERGDIIVFGTALVTEDGGEKKLIKRIIGLPGDHVVIDGGKVAINGEILEETYIPGVETDGRVDLIVGENRFFAMGDNRSVSLDSRSPRVGLVDGDDILGRAWVRLFPFNKMRVFRR